MLHEVVLEHLLGIDKEAQAAKTNELRPRALAGQESGGRGHAPAAIFMNPTKLAQIRDVAGKGEVMPQKSTDFFPKLLDGLCACQVYWGRRRARRYRSKEKPWLSCGSRVNPRLAS